MVKKLLAISVVATTSLPFASCGKEDPQSNQKEVIATLDVENKAREEVYGFMKAIYADAYNGEIIDVAKVDSMSISRGYITHAALRSAEKAPAAQKVEDVLSPQMLLIYNKMLSFIKESKSISKKERDILLSMSSSLSEKERVDMESIIWITDFSLSALNRLSDGTKSGLRSWKAVGTFACNMASGGIGTIWGSMGGAIAAVAGASTIATGGVSLVVGLAVGAAISTIAC